MDLSNLSKKQLYDICKQYKDVHGQSVSKMSRAQLEALVGQLASNKQVGSGKIWDSIKNFGRKAIDSVKNVANDVKKALFFPPNSLPNSSEKVFNAYKDKNITALDVHREPVAKQIQKAINYITGGALDAAKDKLSYDDVFHLYLVMTIDGKQILIEKNERINISDSFNKNSNYESSTVAMDGPILFDTFLNTTREKMGDFAFFQYNAKTNNCQDFITGLLKSNNLGSAENFTFIKQDTEKLFQELPGWASVASQGLTDLGGKLSSLFGMGRQARLQAKGRKRKRRRAGARKAPPKKIGGRKKKTPTKKRK